MHVVSRISTNRDRRNSCSLHCPVTSLLGLSLKALLSHPGTFSAQLIFEKDSLTNLWNTSIYERQCLLGSMHHLRIGSIVWNLFTISISHLISSCSTGVVSSERTFLSNRNATDDAEVDNQGKSIHSGKCFRMRMVTLAITPMYIRLNSVSFLSASWFSLIDRIQTTASAHDTTKRQAIASNAR